MKQGITTTTKSTYLVLFGPKELAEREVFKSEDSRKAEAKFKEKEAVGMYVDVFLETQVTTTTLTKLTDKR